MDGLSCRVFVHANITDKRQGIRGTTPSASSSVQYHCRLPHTDHAPVATRKPSNTSFVDCTIPHRGCSRISRLHLHHTNESRKYFQKTKWPQQRAKQVISARNYAQPLFPATYISAGIPLQRHSSCHLPGAAHPTSCRTNDVQPQYRFIPWQITLLRKPDICGHESFLHS